jgi:septal ring factor EnvC (AmiA/AmiB activator)
MIKLWNYLKQKSKTIHELIKEFPNKSYRELEIYRDKYEKEHKLRQEAETETILVKGIGMNSPEMKAAKLKIEELQTSMDRLRKENSDLYNRIAELTDPERRIQKARESGL